MAEPTKIPTPLVLVLAGTMLAIGAAGVVYRQTAVPARDDSGPTRLRAEPTPVRVVEDTPLTVAETFLDAWRKRDYGVAQRLSIGAAAAAVEARRRREASMPEEQRHAAAAVWNAMARERLTLEVRSTEEDGATTHIAGVARGTFLEQEYANAIRFEIVQRGEGAEQVYRVASMTFPGEGDPFSARPPETP